MFEEHAFQPLHCRNSDPTLKFYLGKSHSSAAGLRQQAVLDLIIPDYTLLVNLLKNMAVATNIT